MWHYNDSLLFQFYNRFLWVYANNDLLSFFFNSELVEQNESLLEKSHELKLNLEQVYDKLRSRIGEVNKLKLNSQ